MSDGGLLYAANCVANIAYMNVCIHVSIYVCITLIFVYECVCACLHAFTNALMYLLYTRACIAVRM